MSKYKILHPKNGVVNTFMELKKFNYEEVYSLEAAGYHKVFLKCQNDFNADYAKLNRRSTCVGDVIYDQERNKFLMIISDGFKEYKREELFKDELTPFKGVSLDRFRVGQKVTCMNDTFLFGVTALTRIGAKYIVNGIKKCDNVACNETFIDIGIFSRGAMNATCKCGISLQTQIHWFAASRFK